MATAAQVYPGIVPAGRARRHINRLREVGLGRRSISSCCDVSDSIIAQIAAGKRHSLRRSTEQRILSVDSHGVSDGCLIDADLTMSRIEALTEDGLTLHAIGKLIKAPGLRKRPKVRAATALRVERLFNGFTN